MAFVPENQPVTQATDAAALNEKAAQLSLASENTPVDSSTAPASSTSPNTEVTSAAPATAPEAASSQAPVSNPAVDSQAPATSKPQGPIKTPIASPLPTCKPEAGAKLTAEQQKKYETVLAAVQEWTELPTASTNNATKSPLRDDERMWLTRECLLRYLRATKWDTNSALTRLTKTLVWRREYMSKITAEHISPENETGKQVLLGFDNSGRPSLYQDPSKQNTKESDRQVQHLVYCLERAIDVMPPGQETLALVINYKNSKRSTSPSLALSRKVLDILQNHYPERLGRALILELPWFISAFFKLITPFIDPVTKPKLRFNDPLVNHIPSAQLWKDYGGELDFTYDHSVYWPALTKLCEERTQEYRSRWEARGKKVGDDEYILRGGQ